MGGLWCFKMEKENKIVVFQDKKIRRTWFNDEWWFVIEDIVFVLTDSKDPKQYIQRLKLRDESLSKGWVQIVHTLSIETAGGKQRMNCTNTKGAFRIIQSIPSKKVRQALTEEWSNRGIEETKEYAILTNEIAKATFGVGIKDHKKIKGLDPKFKNQNLRDHMTDLELIFNMLGEASTTEIAKKKDAQGFSENKLAAKEGGKIAGDARKNLELKTGDKVVSEKNYLDLKKKKKELK